ncbi:two-component system sensor histidine kinase EvgS [Ralstonia sp. GP73]|jgi:two-component system sensor histidine kinase EvgS|uniref:histidine kinase n=2 Tax=Ralstonia TaxID=48736 RepID=A0AAD2F417_9RALS|nr:ATP-binding protein [Ralstonia pickettii]MDH6642094.1 two-component system sensor histidine kinase EvgS [Ralstonia sp. GP73]CAJ0714388.1 Sensor histidine kinase RcsC [Ralstonia sp. LMG 18095]CAJ0791093.1 Sensor histidine kinase RcsC [Ralstonia sp. LMG 18095]CAJ0792653.1 Sensor histidine kinase RcsC [Ralstonia sp. LMG 18095]CAJ0870940.1 Sensor histidine kinase RcsC [Ralstonia sp. LMG 18095]
MGTGGDVSNVAAAVRALILGFWLGLMSGGSNAAPTSLFTPEEDAWIAAHPIVRTCVDAHWRPFEFVKAGKVVGMVPSFLDAVAHVSGLRFDYVDGACWNGSLAALKLGQVDMLPDWSKDEAVAPYRDGYIASTPYYVGTIAIVTAEQENLFASFSQLSGKRLAIKGGGGLELAIRRSSVPVKLVTFQNESDALQAVVDGDADAALGTDASIVPQLHRQFKGQLFLSGSLWDRPYALTMVTRGDNPVLASILDKSLTAISASEADAIRQRWQETTDYGAPSLASILHYRWRQVALVAIIVLAFAVLAYVLWRARVAAVRSEREKAMFLAFISHEIRTPMHTILASLELLQRSQLTGQQASRADAAVSASETLLALLDDVLEYSRLESRSVTLVLQPTAIGPWAEQALDMVRWRSDEKKLALSLDLACAPDFSVDIDAMRVRQIVLNLLVNAIKFTTVGKVVLRVDYLPGKRRGSGTLVLEVRDTGMGIPPERQRNIFEPYARVESPGNRGASGTGLGLSICHELVELMGGVITVSSSPEVGTVFTVMLPAREARAAMALPKAAAAAGASAPHAISPPRAAKAPSPESEEGPLVLVVDDHEAVQHAIQHQLDALACRSAIAGTGEAALEQFASASFDMVLLDCNLPGIDGYTVAQRMREIERQRAGERTPIVAISAATDDAHRIRCFDSGMDGVLGKPLRLAALRELIELWCAHGDSARNAEPMEHDLAPSSDVLAIYRQTMKTDLEMLSQGIARRDIEQARRAAHRISGAAAVVEDLPTRNLARELERRLSDSFSDINAEIQALLVALQSLHGAEAPDA